MRDIKDVQMRVPALSVTGTDPEAHTTARIRGIGTTGDNAGLEASVGIVIHGVLRVRNYGALGVVASYSNAISERSAFRVFVADRKRDGFNDGD